MKIGSSLTLAALVALSATSFAGAVDKILQDEAKKNNIRGHRGLYVTYGGTPATASSIQSKSSSIVAAERASHQHPGAAAATTTEAERASNMHGAAESDQHHPQAIVETAGKASDCSGLFVKFELYTDPGAYDMELTFVDSRGNKYWEDYLETLQDNTIYARDDCLDAGECYTVTLTDDNRDGFANGSYLKVWTDDGSGLKEDMYVRDSIAFESESEHIGKC